MSHYILVMSQGDIVEQGLAQEIFDNPREPYTQKLFKAAFEVVTASESPEN
jgi:ABC-type microcin C transport system duplicated ATPase subunit YejF